MDEFAEVYSRTTGIKQRVPRGWLDDPLLGRDFVKTAAQRTLDGDPRPDSQWINADIVAFAQQNNIDLGGAHKKADLLAAVDAALDPPEPQGQPVTAELPVEVEDPVTPDANQADDNAPTPGTEEN